MWLNKWQWGWRARIGRVYPSPVAEHFLMDFFHVVPEGVTMAISRLSMTDHEDETLERAYAEIPTAVGYLADRKVDCIVIGGSPIMRLKGLQAESELVEKLQMQTGIPTTTTQAAALDALRALKARKVAVATPFAERYTKQACDYLSAVGIAVTAARGLGRLPGKAHDVAPGVAYQHVKSVYFEAPGADAIYVTSGSFSVPKIPLIEAETGVPVVTATHAMIWWALKTLKIRASLGEHGQLLGALA